MKALTTIFESILGTDDTLVWTPGDRQVETATGALAGWGWGS